MALSDFRLKALKPVNDRRLEVADEHGLYIEVLPSGSRVWRYRYLLHGRREKVTVGAYRRQRLGQSQLGEGLRQGARGGAGCGDGLGLDSVGTSALRAGR